MRMRHMQTARCFLCWRDEMLEKRRRENLMRRVVLRFKHLKVSQSFVPWASLARLQHSRRLHEATHQLAKDLHSDLEGKMEERNRLLKEAHLREIEAKAVHHAEQLASGEGRPAAGEESGVAALREQVKALMVAMVLDRARPNVARLLGDRHQPRSPAAAVLIHYLLL